MRLMYTDIGTHKLDRRGRVKRPPLEAFQHFTSNLSLYVVRIRLFVIFGSSSILLQADWGVVPSHEPAIMDDRKVPDILSPGGMLHHRSTNSLCANIRLSRSQSSAHLHPRLKSKPLTIA
jgi:hypothetical protein